MGFIRQQEEKLAVRLLKWQYERSNLKIPAEREIRVKAGQIVDDAHRIARERGKNVLSIIKEMVAEVMKKNK